MFYYTAPRTADYYLDVYCTDESNTSTNAPYVLTAGATLSQLTRLLAESECRAAMGSGDFRGVVDGLVDPQDLFATELVAGMPVTILMHDATDGSPFFQDWNVELRGPAHQLLVQGDSVSVPGTADWSNDQLSYTPAVTGIYYIRPYCTSSNPEAPAP